MNFRKRIFAWLVTALWLNFSLATTATAQTIISDDFSGGLEKWEVVSGPESIWQIEDGILKSRITAAFTRGMLVIKDEYWPAELNGYQVDFDIRPMQGTDKNILFAYESPSDWYEFHLYGSGNEVIKVRNGQVVWQHRADLNNLTAEVWHHITLRLAEGQIVIFHNDTEIFNFLDPLYEGSYYKPGFRVTTGAAAPTEVHFDNFEAKFITNPEVELPVPLLKQTDPLWGNHEYDTASAWANNITIAAWGCALTSAAMILQYHGFVEMPDGSLLNPGSLNQWLKNQPDGYIGGGLVNWLALTRLVQTLAQASGQYALEYRKHLVDLDNIKANIQNLQPVILEIPGHFLVGSGIAENQDLLIKDPAYNFNHFSQHQAQNQELLSYRTFTPSYTDLSYVLVVHPLNTAVNFLHNGEPIPTTTTAEYLAEFGGDHSSSPAFLLTELAKPEFATYELQFSSESYGKNTLTIYAYNQQGQVELQELEIFSGPSANTTQLNLSENFTYQQQYNFEKLATDLHEMVLVGELEYWWVYFQLAELTEHAAVSNSADQLRYMTLFAGLLDFYQPHFSTAAFNYLLDKLQILESLLQENEV